MKKLAKILMTSAIVLILGLYLNSSELYAQKIDQKPGKGFIDLNNDGINDNAIDSDGDGVPNCIDPDVVRQQNRNGSQYSFWYRYNYKHSFKHGYGYGPGDGTGNSGLGPRDGTGFGPGQGTGTCDGTGPKGNKRGGRR